MPKHKSGGEMRPWLSAKTDCREGRFIQLGNSLLLDKHFQNLSNGAQLLYLCAAMESGGKKCFILPLSAAKKYGLSNSGFRRKIAELVGSGFIELVSSGKIVRQPNEYSFTLTWKERSN